MSNKRPFIAGNWKMNMTIPEARSLTAEILDAVRELAESDLVLIPPFTALGEVRGMIEESPLGLGAQDVFWEEAGAFTGEISAPMLKDAGCSYVVIGHSERRQYFGETDAGVNKKTKAALRAGLMPIVCIGETLEERESGRTMAKVEGQVEDGLAGLSLEDLGKVVIAYEPIWAIGTGRTATPGQAEEVHACIRGKLREKYGKDAASCAIILYGGSVKPANAYSLYKEEDIDGFLVGGASLEANSFIGIAKEAVKALKEKK